MDLADILNMVKMKLLLDFIAAWGSGNQLGLKRDDWTSLMFITTKLKNLLVSAGEDLRLLVWLDSGHLFTKH